MKRIQTRFVMIILSGVLLSAIIIGGMAIYSFQEAVTGDSVKIINLTCDKNANELDGILERIEQSVEVMKVHALAGISNPEDLKDSAFCEEYIKELESLGRNIANNTDGAVGVYFRPVPELAGSTAGFFWSKTEDSSAFHALPITDLSAYEPTDMEHVGWYYIPIENGKATWMLPYMNKNNNIYMISYVIPLYKQDTLIGVVGIDIDFKLITDMVSKIQVYESGYAFLTDAEGNIVYHNRLESDKQSGQSDSELTDITKKLSKTDREDMLMDYDYRDTAMKMTYTVLSNDMRLVITAPASEINKEKNQMIGEFVFAATLISLFFVLIMIKNTNSIVASAYYDVLTGARNKNAYQEEVNRLEEQIHFGNTQFAVMVFDINDLKKTNDTYGHTVGDQLIIDGYNQLKHVFKKNPIYRIGGDEFVVILINNSEEECQQLIETFRNENRKQHREKVDMQYSVCVASGYAVYDSTTDNTFSEVFHKADQAMYANKIAMKQETEYGAKE